jgi:membrane protease YdiL (CAAX protease family)
MMNEGSEPFAKWPLILVVGLVSQVPTIGLCFADGGVFGMPVLARIGLNLIMILCVLPGLGAGLPPERRRVLIGSTILIWIVGSCYLFTQNIPSKISGQNFSSLEIFEVLVIGPVAEEFFFRGFIWRLLERTRTIGARTQYLPWIFTSIFFGLYHLGFWSNGLEVATITHVASTIIAGFIFGGIYRKSRSLYEPVAAHGLANLLILSARLF